MKKEKSPTHFQDKVKQEKANRTNKKDVGRHMGNDQKAAAVTMPTVSEDKPIQGKFTEAVVKKDVPPSTPATQIKEASKTEIPKQPQQVQHKAPPSVSTPQKSITQKLSEKLQVAKTEQPKPVAEKKAAELVKNVSVSKKMSEKLQTPKAATPPVQKQTEKAATKEVKKAAPPKMPTIKR